MEITLTPDVFKRATAILSQDLKSKKPTLTNIRNALAKGFDFKTADALLKAITPYEPPPFIDVTMLEIYHDFSEVILFVDGSFYASTSPESPNCLKPEEISSLAREMAAERHISVNEREYEDALWPGWKHYELANYFIENGRLGGQINADISHGMYSWFYESFGLYVSELNKERGVLSAREVLKLLDFSNILDIAVMETGVTHLDEITRRKVVEGFRNLVFNLPGHSTRRYRTDRGFADKTYEQYGFIILDLKFNLTYSRPDAPVKFLNKVIAAQDVALVTLTKMNNDTLLFVDGRFDSATFTGTPNEIPLKRLLELAQNHADKRGIESPRVISTDLCLTEWVSSNYQRISNFILSENILHDGQSS